MASERSLKARIVAAAIAAAGFSAGAALWHEFPRLLVLCAIGMALAIGLMLRSLHQLGLPAPAAAAPPDPESQRLLANALALEARLEHAPAALFLATDAKVAPLNRNARRLLAPGRASDPAALCQQLAQAAPGARSMLSFDSERGAERALLSCSALTLHGRAERIIALLPVESELEAEALKAWRQLVRVLTHEIMNSLTPVASLSRTASELLAQDGAALPPDTAEDLGTALDAISRRAASLVSFVDSYRSLSGVAAPQPERIPLAALFTRLQTLVQAPALLHTSVDPPSLELITDPGQLEQALLNLIQNAQQATEGQPDARITVSARLVRGERLRIEVADNGPGVADELAAHIFTPFFTTRKHGNGIGLAMVRQLVHANGGTVRHAKAVQGGACFVITI